MCGSWVEAVSGGERTAETLAGLRGRDARFHGAVEAKTSGLIRKRNKGCFFPALYASEVMSRH
jgi:hypothetical protein